MTILFDIIEMYSKIHNVTVNYNNLDYTIDNFIINNGSSIIDFIVETKDSIIYVNTIKNILPHNDSIETKLVCEKLMKDTYTDIADFIEEVCDTCSNIKNYCINCGDKLSFTSDILTTCGNDKCKYKLEELIIDDDVFEYVKKYPTTTKLLVDIAAYAIESNKCMDLFDPFPQYFLKSSIDINRGTISKIAMNATDYAKFNNSKDFQRIKNQINRIRSFDFTKILDTPSDKLIAQKFGNDFYYLLRFIIKSCKLEITLDKKHDSISIFKIKNNFVDEEAFKQKIATNNNEKCYLFHGSTSDCWYSILRNGLKVLSGSQLQVNGAAYGSGIYTSNNYSMSYGYCKTTFPIIGVYEVVGNQDKYKKVSGIYVLPSNDVCILRYLIVGKANTPDIMKQINELFEKDILIDEVANKIKMSEKGRKKLMKELEIVKNSFDVSLVDKNICKWHVSTKKATLEIIFPELYPFEPPFVYIKKPTFTPTSKYITKDGALCLEYLTPAIWSPTISIENLLVQIFSLIIEPANKLNDDENNWYHAKKSYEKLAIGNGWIN